MKYFTLSTLSVLPILALYSCFGNKEITTNDTDKFKTENEVSETTKYKIQKEEVAFLSANTWDVSGGGNYGYNSIWVNRNNNIFDNLDYKPKNEVKNLKQLLDIV